MELVEEFGAFLVLNTAEEIKPDVAEWGLMRMRHLLKQLSATERSELVTYFEQKLPETGEPYTPFLRELPDILELRPDSVQYRGAYTPGEPRQRQG